MASREPFYCPGETFTCDGVLLRSVECDDYECSGCFFHEEHHDCLDWFDVHGCCAATDIGRKKSIKFVEVQTQG